MICFEEKVAFEINCPEIENKVSVSFFHRYAIMCGLMAEYDTIQNKIKNGYIFKVSLQKEQWVSLISLDCVVFKCVLGTSLC